MRVSLRGCLNKYGAFRRITEHIARFIDISAGFGVLRSDGWKHGAPKERALVNETVPR